MRGRGERRKFRRKKIDKRKRIMKTFGMREGTLYDRHREKIQGSDGYLDTGNLMHYSNGSVNEEKTRDRNRYGKVERWKHSEDCKILAMEQDIKDSL